MNANKGSILRSSFLMATATTLSRLLGLLRVMLEARVLGGGIFASAWYLAFSIPNLFRRILGEGALGTALIPLIIQQEAKLGKEQIRKDIFLIFSILTIIFSGISIFVSAVAILLQYLSNIQNLTDLFPLLLTERVQISLSLLPILMPYILFICLIGIISSILNSRKIFFVPALGALSLNIFLVGTLAVVYFGCGENFELKNLLPILSYMVLLSGLLQLVLMFFLLYYHGIFPSFKISVFKDFSLIKNLFVLAFPGMIGAAALQISFLVDELLAISLGDQAIPALANVSRIIDLPIGIFAVSFGAVIMSNLSHIAVHGTKEEMEDAIYFALRQVWFLSIPIGFSVVFFHDYILRIIFLGGNYTVDDLNATKMVAIFYGLGIPLFCSLKIILPAFYSRKIMKKPLYSSLIAILCNIILNVILMQFLAQGGIALATVISSLLNNIILLLFLHQEGISLQIKNLLLLNLRNIIISLIAGGIIYGIYSKINMVDMSYFVEVIALLLALGAYLAIYLIVSQICKAKENEELKQIFYSKKIKKT